MARPLKHSFTTTKRNKVRWDPDKQRTPEMTPEQMKRRIEYLESRNPLRNNNVLIHAVEQALALMRGKGYIARRTTSLLSKDKDYYNRFIQLALDPSISKAEMARRLGVKEATVDKHMGIFSSYLHEFLAKSHNLKEDGFGWVEDE